jgi:PAS domain S-box-containing protein
MIGRLDPSDLAWMRISQALETHMGWRLDHLRGQSFLDKVHPADRERARDDLTAALARGEDHGRIYRVLHGEGAVRVVELNVGVRYTADRQPAYLRFHLRDVTAVHRARRALRRRTAQLAEANAELVRANLDLQRLRDRYRDLYEHAPVMYFSTDPDGRIRACNATMLAALGYTREQLVGQPFARILTEKYRQRLPSRLARFRETGQLDAASRWVKADGQEIDVWVSATAVRDENGRIAHSRSVAQDVSAQKRLERELRSRHRELAAANTALSRKIEELDEFTHVVSHDLKEPLRAVLGFARMLRDSAGPALEPDARGHLEQVVEAALRMRTLIDDLLRLAQAGRTLGELRAVPLDEVVETARQNLAERVRQCHGEVLAVGELGTLWGDRTRLVQLFTNLIGNGLKYNQSATPTVRVTRRDVPSAGITTIAVSDNGIGIAAADHDRIFRLFRRLHTREEYEGTGAGLAICDKIVRAHGGTLHVESSPGAGAAFVITLPRRDDLGESGADEGPPSWPGDERAQPPVPGV